jgi:K+ transporter
MNTTTFDPVEMSRGISEYGFMVVASACFLFTSVTIMFLFFRWHTRILNSIIDTQQQSLKEILQSLREHNYQHIEQSRILEEIREKVN